MISIILLLFLGNTFSKPCNKNSIKKTGYNITISRNWIQTDHNTLSKYKMQTKRKKHTGHKTQTKNIDTTPTQTKNINTTPTSIIKVRYGKNATLTYFTDTVFQCISSSPIDNAIAVNPLLLGFTLQEWNDKYAKADPSVIPWCGRKMEVVVKNQKFTGTIIDTCNPGGNGAFQDPNTGLIIGGKCDYENVIDLYGNNGLEFLQSTVGDNFYQGEVLWRLLDV
jgi:hypothetical protein